MNEYKTRLFAYHLPYDITYTCGETLDDIFPFLYFRPTELLTHGKVSATHGDVSATNLFTERPLNDSGNLIIGFKVLLDTPVPRVFKTVVLHLQVHLSLARKFLSNFD